MSLKRWIVVMAVVVGLIGSSGAQAVQKSMGGELVILNPSIGGANSFNRGPDYHFGSVSVAGTSTGTTVGRTLTLPQGAFGFEGAFFRFFPGVPAVAQQTSSFVTTQMAATFAPGSGAAASGDISFCPPINNVPAASTAGGGDRSCTFFNGASAGAWPIRIGVNNANPVHYGGTLSLLKNQTGNVWFVLGAPTPTGNLGVVSAQPQDRVNAYWAPGWDNYQFSADPADPGPNYRAVVTPTSGRIGTIVSSLGLGTVDPDDGSGWGFRMTTGTISGSVGNPPTTPTSNPTRFFFTRMGEDSVTSGGNRNLVLVGGGVLRDGSSQSLFHQVSRLRMSVPEPSMGMALLIGAGTMLGFGLASKRRGR